MGILGKIFGSNDDDTEERKDYVTTHDALKEETQDVYNSLVNDGVYLTDESGKWEWKKESVWSRLFG